MKEKLAEFGRQHPGWSVVYVLILLVILVSDLVPAIGALIQSGSSYQFSMSQALQYLATFGTVAFVQLFTSLIPGDDGATEQSQAEQKKCELIRYWLIFSYAFMYFALLVSIYPFLNTNPTETTIGNTVAPISMFVGCSVDGDVPEEIQCVSNTVLDVDATGTPATGDNSATINQSNRITRRTPVAVQWLINLGGTVSRCTFDNEQFNCTSGGVQIPLYFVIFSLVGGAISLTRRLPEYQKRSSASFRAQSAQKDTILTAPEVREYLIFQIVQFVSAPFLALVAYLLISPETQISTAIIGFAAGFSSETILLQVRRLMDNWKPKGLPTTKQSGAVFGVVLDYVSHRGVAGAEVTVGDMVATTDDSGLFSLSNLETGKLTLKASKNDKTVEEEISITANQSVSSTLMLK